MSHFTLRQTPPALQWAGLLVASVVCIAAFELMRLPAALMLGALAGAILVASFEGRVHIPPRSFILAQGVIGCLIAKAIGAASPATMLAQWPIFLIGIGTVMAFAAGLGMLLARWKVLPGTTAIWGSSPGAATAMVLMAEAFGADIRLVAVMQYLRVAFVGLIASVVAREWAAPGSAAPMAVDWFPAFDPMALLATLAIAVGGAVIGVKSKIPAGALLVTLFIATALSAAHVVTITLPPWLLAATYAVVGWSIGFRFTRPMIGYAARQLPRIVASIMTLIAMCGGLAYALHIVVGTDPLTAYLATSPGGADSVAIIAASSKVDLPFVMTMQIGRAIVAILIGPALARFLTRWTVGDEPASSGDNAAK
jgi:membrane AbrB-like protein